MYRQHGNCWRLLTCNLTIQCKQEAKSSIFGVKKGPLNDMNNRNHSSFSSINQRYCVEGKTLSSGSQSYLVSHVQSRGDISSHLRKACGNLTFGSQIRAFCQASNQSNKGPDETNSAGKSNKSRMKILIRDYGATAVVFHVAISLVSLGVCYVLISSSVPMDKLFALVGLDKKLGDHNSAATTSTNFIVAYAFHKSLAPIRLSITAASLPFVVRFLRAKNILKPPKN
ncbi:protein FAM210B, mitochondrial-like [Brevipalpus obovatus]|uniref:protein FAM210B, mitochondrial-like n=1 Tax=Brevipalpus obovatus TaxID=246614 RepID=UPI003D9E8492